jgi:nitrogen fixation protein NifB
VDLYCQGGYGEEEALDGVIKAIADCAAVLVAKIGHCPQEQLQQAGIEAVTAHAFDYIETAALKYFQTYVERLAAGEVVQGAGRDALIRQGAYMAS